MTKMQTFKIYAAQYSATFNPMDAVLTTATKAQAVFADLDSGDQYVFSGENFKYKHGVLDSGFVTGLSLVDGEEGAIVKIAGTHVDVNKLPNTGVFDFVQAYSAQILNQDKKITATSLDDTIVGANGDDKILVLAGDDFLAGNKGDDVLTGGAGSDTFAFNHGDGKDTITDFVATGGEGIQDYIQFSASLDYDIVKDGKNTIIDFGHGDSITLLDVKASMVGEDDFRLISDA